MKMTTNMKGFQNWMKEHPKKILILNLYTVMAHIRQRKQQIRKTMRMNEEICKNCKHCLSCICGDEFEDCFIKHPEMESKTIHITIGR